MSGWNGWDTYIPVTWDGTSFVLPGSTYLYNGAVAANKERGYEKWSGNILEIGVDANGGTIRDLKFSNVSGTAGGNLLVSSQIGGGMIYQAANQTQFTGTLGAGAIDLQTNRSAALNGATGTNAVALGANSIASATGAFAAGTNIQTTANYAAAMGVGSVASGQASIALGHTVLSSANFTFSAGQYSVAGAAYQFAFGFGRFTTSGDKQISIVSASAQSSSTSVVNFTFTMPYAANNGTTWEADITIVGRSLNSLGSASARRKLLVSSAANATATLTLGSANLRGTDGDSLGSDAPTFTISSATVSGATLTIPITPAKTNATNWLCTMILTEVGRGTT